MSGAVTVLYFASLGERLACQRELIELHDKQLTVSELKKQLAERGEVWQKELEKPNLRTAVNQEIISGDPKLQAGDEVAFFPPVTGG